MAERKIYVTTYCNFGHDVATGKPIGHECYVIPPAALRAEMNGDYDGAIDIIHEHMPLKAHRGLKANPESAADVIEALVEWSRVLKKPVDSEEAAQIVDTMTSLETGKTLWLNERTKLTPELYLRELDKRLETHGVEAIFDQGDGTTSSRPPYGMDDPVAEYLNTGDTYSTTILFDYEAGKRGMFMITTWGDFVEKWEREHEDDGKILTLENSDDEGEDWVMAHISGPRACAIAKNDQSIEGTHWECDGDDFAYAKFPNRENLVEDLEKEGWTVNADQYSPPDEE